MSDPKPTINIPAGNSPVTPEPAGEVAPTRFIHGAEPSKDDFKAAVAVSCVRVRSVLRCQGVEVWGCRGRGPKGPKVSESERRSRTIRKRNAISKAGLAGRGRQVTAKRRRGLNPGHDMRVQAMLRSNHLRVRAGVARRTDVCRRLKVLGTSTDLVLDPDDRVLISGPVFRFGREAPRTACSGQTD